MNYFFQYTKDELRKCFRKHETFRNVALNSEQEISIAVISLISFIDIDSFVELTDLKYLGKIKFGIQSKKDCTVEQFNGAVIKLQVEFDESRYYGWPAIEILKTIEYFHKHTGRTKDIHFVGITNETEEEIKLKYYPSYRDIYYFKLSSNDIAQNVYTKLVNIGYEKLAEMDEARNIFIFSKSRKC